MWNALRSDLKEFVSTVADDTSNVLSQLDTGLNESNDDNDDDDNDDDTTDPTTKTVVHRDAEINEILKLLRDHPGTYTKDLLAEEDDDEGEKKIQRPYNPFYEILIWKKKPMILPKY